MLPGLSPQHFFLPFQNRATVLPRTLTASFALTSFFLCINCSMQQYGNLVQKAGHTLKSKLVTANMTNCILGEICLCSVTQAVLQEMRCKQGSLFFLGTWLCLLFPSTGDGVALQQRTGAGTSPALRVLSCQSHPQRDFVFPRSGHRLLSSHYLHFAF